MVTLLNLFLPSFFSRIYFSDKSNDFLQVQIHTARIPALGEQLESQTKEAREFAALQVAKQLAKSAMAGFEQAQEQEREELISLRESVYSDAQTEVKILLVTVTETIDLFDASKASALDKKRIAKIEARLKVLVEFDSNGAITQALEAVRQTNQCFKQHSQQILDNFEQKLAECLQLVKQATAEIAKSQTPKLRSRTVSF